MQLEMPVCCLPSSRGTGGHIVTWCRDSPSHNLAYFRTAGQAEQCTDMDPCQWNPMKWTSGSSRIVMCVQVRHDNNQYIQVLIHKCWSNNACAEKKQEHRKYHTPTAHSGQEIAFLKAHWGIDVAKALPLIVCLAQFSSATFQHKTATPM